MKAILKTLFKLMFVIGLLYWLAQKNSFSIQRTAVALTQWQYIGPAFAVYLITTFLGIVRWRILLKAHSIDIPLWRCTELNMVGLFFNVALPGAVTGDFVKAFYIGRESEGKRADAFGSILFDRVVGLAGLVILCAVAILLGFDTFRGSERFHALTVFVEISAAVALAFFAYLFFVTERHDPFLLFLKSLEKRIPRVGALTRVYLGLRYYHHHPWAMLSTLLISVVVHSMVGWACMNFAHALGEMHLSVNALYVAVPPGLLVTAVPVAPGGIGTGHVAFREFFRIVGSEAGADVFSLVVLTNFALGALGGLVYLRFKSRGEVAQPSLSSGANEPTTAS